MSSRAGSVFAAALAASILTLSVTGSAWAAAPAADEDVWTPTGPVDESALTVAPADYAAFRLDLPALTAALPPTSSYQATLRRAAPTETTLSLPTPTGEFVSFRVQPVDLLEPALQARHPELRTFAGRGVDDDALSLRADITPLGFHAMVRSGDNSTRAWYIDPATVGQTGTYLSYPAGALPTPRLKETTQEHGENEDPSVRSPSPQAAGAQSRTVRLALASSPSFADFYGTENVLAAKVAITNRVASVYNDDLGVRLVLADGTDDLNFDTAERAFDADGPCGPEACYTEAALVDCDVETLNQNSRAVQTVIGNEGYDVGHIVLGAGGGGMAGYGEVGLNFVKGGGCTANNRPTGDAFAIDYVAHEIGHQLGASHTYNACGGSSGSTAVEPGSGSTIMAYAGLCGDNNLQPHSDPYFSQASIVEIHRTLDERIAGTDSGNVAPTVTAPAPRTIPVQTPFVLSASGSDADDDTVSYLWEQSDAGDPDRALFDDAKADGPLFRTFGTYVDTRATAFEYFSAGRHLATDDPGRTFPDMAQILSGNTNAASGSCDPALSQVAKIECYSEHLPTSVYRGNGTDSINFRVTARDSSPRGGGVAFADVQLTLDQTAGPLLVEGLDDAPDGYLGGSRHDVRWSVNDTDRAGLAPTVRISLSTDGGETFSRALAEATPNDGFEPIVLPNVETTDARIRVEAIDNYFFAIDPEPFAIQKRATPAALSADRAEAAPGTYLTVTGSGFLPGEEVLLTAPGWIPVRFTSDAHGGFTRAVRLPADESAGNLMLTVTGVRSGLAATLPLQVVPVAIPSPAPPTATPLPVAAAPANIGSPGHSTQADSLAATGSDIGAAMIPTMAALLAVAVGFAILARKRRRPKHPSC